MPASCVDWGRRKEQRTRASIPMSKVLTKGGRKFSYLIYIFLLATMSAEMDTRWYVLRYWKQNRKTKAIWHYFFLNYQISIKTFSAFTCVNGNPKFRNSATIKSIVRFFRSIKRLGKFSGSTGTLGNLMPYREQCSAFGFLTIRHRCSIHVHPIVLYIDGERFANISFFDGCTRRFSFFIFWEIFVGVEELSRYQRCLLMHRYSY